MFVRWVTLISLLIFSLAAPAKSRKPTQIDPELNIMVIVHRGQPLKAWIGALPGGAQIVKEFHPFYLIRLVRPITPAQLERLKRTPAIREVKQSKPVTPAASASRCVETAQTNNREDLLAMAVATGQCDIFLSCSSDGRPALQAQLAVGADLMLEEMKRMGIEDGHTKVAVFDSGFSPTMAEFMNRRPTFEHNERGDTAAFSEGKPHGTAVAGLIGGKGGVGLAPGADIGIYRVDTKENGDSDTGTVEASLLEACHSGHKIINLSYEKIYTDRDNPLIVEQLEEMGCMVVNSAGNMPGNGINNTDKDDGWLRVGGKDVQSGTNSPLELGEVNAPGFYVGTLDPNAEGTCGGQPMQSDHGTSFAAPIVTGILANVRAVLAKDPAFNALKGPQQIDLLNRILRGSTAGGMVNGLRAVLMAEQWTKTAGPKPSSEAQVAAMLTRNPPAICARPPASTELTDLACEARKRSVSEHRFRAAACTPLQEENLTKFILALVETDEAAVAKNLTHYLPAAGNLLGQVALREREIALIRETEEKREQQATLQSAQEELTRVKTLIFSEVPGSALAEWSAALSAADSNSQAAIAAAQRKLREFELAPGRRQDQTEALRAEIAAHASQRACIQGWQQGFVTRLAGQPVDAGRFHQLVAQTKASSGCDSVVSYLSSPYRELATSATNGQTFDSYKMELLILKTNAEIQVMELQQ